MNMGVRKIYRIKKVRLTHKILFSTIFIEFAPHIGSDTKERFVLSSFFFFFFFFFFLLFVIGNMLSGTGEF